MGVAHGLDYDRRLFLVVVCEKLGLRMDIDPVGIDTVQVVLSNVVT